MRIPAGWTLAPQAPQLARELAGACGLSPITAQVLINRGLRTRQAVDQFFHPQLDALNAPEALPGLEQAAHAVRRVLRRDEPILIFGDSDVDGITASAILYEWLTAHGGHVLVRLSDRLRDGYGLPMALAQQAGRLGIKLAIVVDCGTNQPDEIATLRAQGVTTVVLDHHVPGERPAKPDWLVNPHQHRETAGQELCSAGLAFKLVQALTEKSGELEAAMDLAALGTMADCAPLIGDNRVLICAGRQRLADTGRPGLRALLTDLGVVSSGPDQIFQKVVPRLNAAGRLGNPMPAWELLVERSDTRGAELAHDLAVCHEKTRALSRQAAGQAHEAISRTHFRSQHVLVIGRVGWHAGVMGPVASQMMERYGRPTFAVALDGQVGVGSGRSPSGFDLYQALRACEGMLLRYGGHAQACGITIQPKQLEPFREAINQHAQAQALDRDGGRQLAVDAVIRLKDVTETVASQLDQLKPHGPGNRRPALLVEGVRCETDDDGTWLVDDACRLSLRHRAGPFLAEERYDVVISPTLKRGEPAAQLVEARLSFDSAQDSP